MTDAKDVVRPMCALIDRCGENIPLTTFLVAKFVDAPADDVQDVLDLISERTKKIKEYAYLGRKIWVRPEHIPTWYRRSKQRRIKKRF